MLHRNEKIVPKSSQRKISEGCVFPTECYFKENCLMHFLHVLKHKKSTKEMLDEQKKSRH